jgi:hypothetical protein
MKEILRNKIKELLENFNKLESLEKDILKPKKQNKYKKKCF